jgi:hypothetical protein
MALQIEGEVAMPELHQPDPASAGLPPAVAMAAAPDDDFDYALGCECADPSLHIACWSSETGPAPRELS